jgi:hypothetical protein
MMSMFHRDGANIMVTTGKAQWEGDGIRFEDEGVVQVGAYDWIEAVVGDTVVGKGRSFMAFVPAGSLLEFRQMKPSREVFTAEEIEAARKPTTVTVLNQERYGCEGGFVFDGKLDDVIGSLVKIREEIPEEYRASAECVIESESGYEDSHYATILVTYSRPETDDEVTKRLKSELIRNEQAEKEERAAFERLQKKYGTG